jgi:hypothetical protein
MLTADYTNGGAKRPATLTIAAITDGRRIVREVHNVSGKREARELATRLGAKPWNF